MTSSPGIIDYLTTPLEHLAVLQHLLPFTLFVASVITTLTFMSLRRHP